MGWIAWIIVGGLAGWVASKIMGTDAQQGIVLNIVVGIVGALIGGFILTSLIGFTTTGWISGFITALIGACLLLFIVKLVTGRSGTRV